MTYPNVLYLSFLLLPCLKCLKHYQRESHWLIFWPCTPWTKVHQINSSKFAHLQPVLHSQDYLLKYLESEIIEYSGYSSLTCSDTVSSCYCCDTWSIHGSKDRTYISYEVWGGICGKCHFPTISSLSKFNFFQTCKIK